MTKQTGNGMDSQKSPTEPRDQRTRPARRVRSGKDEPGVPPFLTALIIEAEILPRMALRQQLLQAGLTTVHEAMDGEDGMAWLSGRGVELLFAEWEPGGVSGADLLRHLRGKGRTPRIPMVLLDWGLPQSAVVNAVKAGAAGRLVMPPTLAKVRAVLRDVVDANSAASPRKGEAN